MLLQPTSIGPYRILKCLESTNLSETFLACGSSGTTELVAVKRLQPVLSDDPVFVEMFEHEAKISRSLSHPNLVKTLNSGHDAGVPFVVTEYFGGVQLRKLLNWMKRREHRFQPAAAVSVALQVARALDAIHTCTDLATGQPLGIIHRDVCPLNILIDENGSLKLSNLGVAKSAVQEMQTQPGVLKGRFGYFAPEAVSGEPVTPQSDLFSLGVILWELLANERLFAGTDEKDAIEMVLKFQGPPEPSADLRIPTGVLEIAKGALLRNPAQRFSSAKEMAELLEDTLQAIDPIFTSADLGNWVSVMMAAVELHGNA